MDGIVSIMKGENIEGVGVLIDKDIIITCAHVINTSFGLNKNSQPNPSSKGFIFIRFPFNDDETPFRCRIMFWSPMPTQKSRTIDIALLKVIDPIPDSLTFVRFSLVKKYENREVKVIGFPKTFKNGEWAFGRVDGQIANKRYQISGESNQFAPSVESRFSGSPVIDSATGEIIGILNAKRFEPNKRIYYMLPTYYILDSYSSFSQYIRRTLTASRIMKEIIEIYRDVSHMISKTSGENAVVPGLVLAALTYYVLTHSPGIPNPEEHSLLDSLDLPVSTSQDIGIDFGLDNNDILVVLSGNIDNEVYDSELSPYNTKDLPRNFDEESETQDTDVDFFDNIWNLFG